ncbi:Abi family protein [Listeria rustica]|uniref:Abi family protein n=1 Tax=Listeria rustica TaxID=2713503 RepID=A0A7W1T7S3_9LIST|nr:Abi family protein [Listeria rustica]MBA3927012.1 Abi family protein [Listeria rustica]
MLKTDKPATTYREQIGILKKKGMLFPNEIFAENFLEKVQYYRLSGYWLSYFEEKDKFVDGLSFEKIASIYIFDKELRNNLLYVIDNIETEVKSKIAYRFVHDCSPLSYMNAQNFRREEYHAIWLEKFYRIANIKDRNKELFVSWYKDNYNSKFPFWVVVEMCNFNDISKFYNNLKPKVKKRMRGCFQHDYEYIESWLHTTVLIRNICAHNGRLYNRSLAITPKLLTEMPQDLNTKRIFTPILILKYLCSDREIWNEFVKRMEKTFDKYEEWFELEQIGFPSNWRSLLK